MITQVIHRRVAPLDGTWFNARMSLGMVMNGVICDNEKIPDLKGTAGSTPVPVWISVTKSGGKLCPFVRIGSMESESIEFWSAWAAGLCRDHGLDPENRFDDCWCYLPWDADKDENEDATTFYCDGCKQSLFRDDLGRRESRSACLDSSGNRICRNCDAVGPIYCHKTEKHIQKCKRLADAIGPECRERLDRDIEHICNGMWFGNKYQNYVYRDGRFSFGWHVSQSGRGKCLMNGGLILHEGYIDISETEEGFEFEYNNYHTKERRPATPEEVGNIRWSIHT